MNTLYSILYYKSITRIKQNVTQSARTKQNRDENVRILKRKRLFVDYSAAPKESFAVVTIFLL